MAFALLVLPDARAHQKHKTTLPVEVESPAEAREEPPGEWPHAGEAESPESGPHDSTEPAHTHPAEPEEKTGVARLLAWFGKLHPPLTQFPVALLSAAALGELLLLRRPGAFFDHAVRFCVWGGAASAVVVGVLGWLFAGFQLTDDEWPMTAHRWVGTATALWAVLLLVVCMRMDQRPTARRTFRIVLFAGAGLVTVSGFLGGALIYGLDHHAW